MPREPSVYDVSSYAHWSWCHLQAKLVALIRQRLLFFNFSAAQSHIPLGFLCDASRIRSEDPLPLRCHFLTRHSSLGLVCFRSQLRLFRLQHFALVAPAVQLRSQSFGVERKLF